MTPLRNAARHCLLATALLISLSGPAVAQPAPAAAAEQAAARQGRIDAAYADYTVRYYEKLTELQDNEIEKLKWQSRAADVTLWLVVFVVISGLAMSAYQLWGATRAGKDIEQMNLEISSTQLRVTSSIVGLAILVVSIAFLYLFLRDVYTMKPWDLARLANNDPRAVANAMTADGASVSGKEVSPNEVIMFDPNDPRFQNSQPPSNGAQPEN